MSNITQAEESSGDDISETITQEEETSGNDIPEKQPTSYDWGGMRYEDCRALFEGSEPIKVTVGADSNQRTWYLPKKVLTHCSPFFDAALNGNFAEASLKAVDLPEDDLIAFEIWATWLSLGTLSLGRWEGPFYYADFDHSYIRAWVLGDKLVCPAFKDHVMFQFLDQCDNGGDVYLDQIRLVYGVSSPGSKLRRLFVDWFVWDKQSKCLANYKDEIIAFSAELPEFMKDVLVAEVVADKDTSSDPSEHKYRYYENPAFKPEG